MSYGARLKAAFLAPANLWSLLVTGTASAVTGEAVPMVIAAGAELVYLGVLAPFMRPRAEQGGDAPSGEVKALLDGLAPSQREHYLALRALRDRILAQYRQLPGGRVLVESTQSRVDALLTSFLRLLETLNAYREFLSSADRKAVEAELAEVNLDLARETNPRLLEVKEKRAQILRLRLARFEEAKESREVVAHQLAGIEDLLRLTLEQSLSIRDASSAARQLELLTAGVESTQETVQEMSRFLEFTEELRPVPSHGTRART